jgi:hypothetical protein
MSNQIELEVDNIVVVNYTNYRGETQDRKIRPIRIWFGSTQWHPTEQWLMDAIDLERNVQRTFAMCDIHNWEDINHQVSGKPN